MKPPRKFILIDDDPINNFITKEIINLTFREPTSVLDFTNAQKCLEYIMANYINDATGEPTALFVDLNMPVMTGWEFLEKFDQLAEDIKKWFVVFIISSSINPLDKKKAESNPSVKDYITKPISEEFLMGIAC